MKSRLFYVCPCRPLRLGSEQNLKYKTWWRLCTKHLVKADTTKLKIYQIRDRSIFLSLIFTVYVHAIEGKNDIDIFNKDVVDFCTHQIFVFVICSLTVSIAPLFFGCSRNKSSHLVVWSSPLHYLSVHVHDMTILLSGERKEGIEAINTSVWLKTIL